MRAGDLVRVRGEVLEVRSVALPDKVVVGSREIRSRWFWACTDECEPVREEEACESTGHTGMVRSCPPAGA